MDAEVAVVGGGVMGLMTALALQRRGVDVVVFERYEAGNERGSSHGPTRIFRYLYDDPLYVDMAARSLPLWEAFGNVLEMTGGVQIDEPAVLARYRDAMSPWGVRTERMDANTMWLDKMGIIDAARTIARAKEVLGDAVVEGHAIETLGDVRAPVVVLAAGAWIGDFVDLPVKVTREQVMYFEGDTSGMLPWVHSAHWIYGIPRDGRVKVAEHHGGAVTTADTRTFELDEAAAERVTSYVQTHLPTVDPAPVSFETCLYTTTANEDFIIERWGDVVVVSACSGHGFKFAPLVGEIAACLAVGDESPIALDRFTS
jgi:glycine/D-amino acid oxidase-like deaminating enzyme